MFTTLVDVIRSLPSTVVSFHPLSPNHLSHDVAENHVVVAKTVIVQLLAVVLKTAYCALSLSKKPPLFATINPSSEPSKRTIGLKLIVLLRYDGCQDHVVCAQVMSCAP